MPHHKSTAKRLRQSEKLRQRNVHFKSEMRTAVKKVHQALDSDDTSAAQDELCKAVKIIDSNRSKGIIHARTASRKVSRLTRAVNAKSS